MHTRGDILKLAGIATPAMLIGGALSQPATAFAMYPKIDAQLKLNSDGSVSVTGPFNGWDTDEKSARVQVMVVQGLSIASGISGRYQHGAASWAAKARGTGLKPGHAVGYATAAVYLYDETTEFYSWQVPVTLVAS